MVTEMRGSRAMLKRLTLGAFGSDKKWKVTDLHNCLFDFTVEDNKGNRVDLGTLCRDKVTVIVNVASK